MLRRRPFFLFPLLAASLLSCVNLPTIEETRCGNGFIEPGEDCDNFDQTTPKDGGAKGAVCNASGTVNQCRFSCEEDSDCKSDPVSGAGSGWRCGVDKICRQPKGDEGGKGTYFTPASSLIKGSVVWTTTVSRAPVRWGRSSPSS